MNYPVTQKDIDRIEEKLDKIIQYFNIGKAPQLSNQNLEEIADSMVISYNENKRSRSC